MLFVRHIYVYDVILFFFSSLVQTLSLFQNKFDLFALVRKSAFHHYKAVTLTFYTSIVTACGRIELKDPCIRKYLPLPIVFQIIYEQAKSKIGIQHVLFFHFQMHRHTPTLSVLIKTCFKNGSEREKIGREKMVLSPPNDGYLFSVLSSRWVISMLCKSIEVDHYLQCEKIFYHML